MDLEFPQRATGDSFGPQPVALLGGGRSLKKQGLVGDIWLLWECSAPKHPSLLSPNGGHCQWGKLLHLALSLTLVLLPQAQKQ